MFSASLVVALVVFSGGRELVSIWRTAIRSPEELAAVEHQAYYSRCSEAWAAGAAPIYRGSPGYREGLDGDGDGIACEPYRNR